MHLLVLLLTWAGGGAAGGGAVSGVCPAVCRCEGVGMLQRVDCVDSGLRSVPPDLSSLTSALDVSMNELSELPAHVFAGLQRLHELRLAGNSLAKISSEAFRGLVSLKLLSLQNNHLRTVPSDALENLKNLRSLRLDANFISHLPASSFEGLASLHHLWLDDNVLTEVPVLALSALTELQALTLAVNNISYVPDRAFASLRRLLVLHLHDNRIHSLGRRSFDGLHSLETLDLSFNRIDGFPAAIKRLSDLRDLNLQNNNIRVVPEHAFSGNPSIRTINIQNNPLHSVGHSTFRLLPDLRTLSLSGSSITELPDFTGTHRLETLSITGSHISILPNTICEELPNLHQLDLSRNPIQSLPSFSGCRKIKNIDLTSSQLSSVSLRTLRSLTHLKLSAHLQLGVSHQHQPRLRGAELPSVCLQSERPSSSNAADCPSTWLSLRLLYFSVSLIFTIFTLPLLFLSLPPPSSQRHLALLLLFRLLAGLSGCSIVSTDCFCADSGPGSGLWWVFLSWLPSEVCVLMAVVLKTRTWTRVVCAVVFGLALTALLLILILEISLCSSCFLLTHSALMLLNTSCFLFTIGAHVTHRQRGVHVALAFLLLTKVTLLFSASFLCLSGPDVSPPAAAAIFAFIMASLPCCLDPIVIVVFIGPGFRGDLQSFQSEDDEESSRQSVQTFISVPLENIL